MKTRTLIYCALVTCFALAATAGTNLIVNGSFEIPRVPTNGFTKFSSPTNFPGWIVSSGGVDVVDTNYFPSASGLQSLDLNARSPGNVYQDISTTAGDTYTLRFALMGNPAPPTIKRMEVTWNSNLLATLEFQVSQPLVWQSYSFSVVGTGSDRLAFHSLIPGSAGAAIDDVVLTQGTNTAGLVNGLTIARAAQICWPSTAGRFYQVQWASRADTNVWNYLGLPVQGDGGIDCVCDPIGSNSMRIYRVIESD